MCALWRCAGLWSDSHSLLFRVRYNTLGQMLAKAVKHGHVDTCKLLLDRKANILFRDDTGRSLLHIAARSRNEGVLKLLLQAASRSPAHASAASSIPGQSFGLNLSFHLTAEDRLRWLDALDGQGTCSPYVVHPTASVARASSPVVRIRQVAARFILLLV